MPFLANARKQIVLTEGWCIFMVFSSNRSIRSILLSYAYLCVNLLLNNKAFWKKKYYLRVGPDQRRKYERMGWGESGSSNCPLWAYERRYFFSHEFPVLVARQYRNILFMKTMPVVLLLQLDSVYNVSVKLALQVETRVLTTFQLFSNYTQWCSI